MKKIFFYIGILASALFVFSACDETINPVGNEQGTITITSTPAGAAIYLDGSNTGKVTPSDVTDDIGQHEFELRLTGYVSYSFFEVLEKNTPKSKSVTLTPTSSPTLEIQSDPSGAEIWVDGSYTGAVTPGSINVSSTNKTLTLKLDGYYDYTQQVNTSTSSPLYASLEAMWVEHATVRIYENASTGASEPSGLDLSTGNATAISGSDKLLADIFFNSNGDLVASADMYPGLSRITYFKIGGGSNIFDGANSPAYSASWTKSIPTTTGSYIYLYDNDNHYSKILIVERRAPRTNSSQPAGYVDIKVLYQIEPDNTEF